MKTAIGVFAHVDAGKTTFCESLLHLTGSLTRRGRVDHRDTLMDHDETERRRGITIFSDIAGFRHGGRDFYLIDTPGHVDFSAEMERALSVLDCAILLVSGTDGVQGHTLTVYRLLRERGIPVYFFINKLDVDTADREGCLADIRARLTGAVFSGPPEGPALCEFLAEYDEALMEAYLEDRADGDLVRRTLGRLIAGGQVSLAAGGSALTGEGVLDLLDLIAGTLPPGEPRYRDFAARVFKVIHDRQGVRVTLIKCLGGALAVKDEVEYAGGREKVHELRAYQGERYTGLGQISAGDIAGVTGLTAALPGMGLGGCPDTPEAELRPALRAAVLADAPHDTVMAALGQLEAQDPLLQVEHVRELDEIQVAVMGKIQLEVLAEVIPRRYGFSVKFGPCRVVYRETIGAPVTGYGHYEPLKHYAEVHLRMEPAPGEGIVFASTCPTDRLPRAFQHQIRQGVLERRHWGVLTGGALTDVRFTLVAGRHHIKHTEGGDFREATWRAVRQGLERAESVLLEPFYEMIIDVETGHMGRVLSDITRLSGTFSPPEPEGGRVRITARGPVSTFLDYPAELAAFTSGRGAVSAALLGYFPCHNREEVIREIGYERERDLENPSSSVFCARGAGFEVKWDQVESYLSIPPENGEAST